jgi:hypothetical protein
MTGQPDGWMGEMDEAHPDGVTPLEIADLPETPRQLLMQMVREQAAHPEGYTPASLHAEGLSNAALEALLDRLVQAGWLSAQGEDAGRRYRVRLRSRRVGGAGALWATLSDVFGDEPHS